MQLLAKSLKGEEIARELFHVLSTDYRIGSSCLLAAMRDRAASNGVAMRTVALLYPKLLDVGCFPILLTTLAIASTLLRLLSLEWLG